MAKKKIKIDGRDLEKKNENKPKTIAECLGWDTKVYNTNDAMVYKDYLDSLNLAELHRHGLEMAGIRPNSDRGRMNRMLIEAFERYWLGVKAAGSKTEPTKIDPTKEAKAKKIFSQWG